MEKKKRKWELGMWNGRLTGTKKGKIEKRKWEAIRGNEKENWDAARGNEKRKRKKKTKKNKC